MQTLKRMHEAYTEWVQQTKWVHRPLFLTVNAFMIAMGFMLIVFIPAVILLAVMHSSGIKNQNGTEFLSISVTLKVTLSICILFVAVVSGALAGLMRSLFRGGMFDIWWVMLSFFAASASLFIYVSFVVRQTTTALTSVGGDTPTVVAFLTGWLLLLGYTAKVPWDEFRDRCAALFDGKWELRRYWDQSLQNATSPTSSSRGRSGS
ncbi:hypothetical protein U1707_17335 [Sphingomonas sp. PB2P12]|uniref:hypothetical protein n=1 Tax=Sphingomonas sandaracina TaxID=3096157 RepID=UPI002FC747E2